VPRAYILYIALATIETAKQSLQDLGFVVLKADEGLVDAQLVASAREEALTELDTMLARLRRQGFDTEAYSFSFSEVVHRSPRRYDMQLDRRRLPPSSPWNPLGAATADWAKPIIEACGVEEERELAVEGLLTSLPGAPHQRFHQDGPNAGSYNCFLPLVDVGAQQSGTEFWEASHTHPAVPPLVLSGALGVEDASQLAVIADDPHVHLVQPNFSSGDLLIYQYRVIHRGYHSV